MASLRILNEPRLGEEAYEKLKQELPFRTQSSFNLFGGEKEMVTLRCPAYYYNVIVDKFGTNLVPRIVDREKEICEVDVPVAVGDQFFGWIFGMKNKIQIVGPDSVRKKMLDMSLRVARCYGYNHYYH